MAGTIQAGTLISSNSRSIDVDDIGVRSYAGGGGAFNYRNKIVDGRFDFWYEGTSQTSSGYGSDTMWFNGNVGSTKTHSQQALTVGVDLPAIDCPSAQYFSRTIVTSVTGAANFVIKTHRIENVHTLAGKTVTLSFYAKANASKNIAVELLQDFGLNGSAQVVGIGSQLVGLTSSWAKYSVTITLPSVANKTINEKNMLVVHFWFDAGSDYAARAAYLGQQSGTFDIACVQLEEGSVATPYEDLSYTVLALLVWRYYEPVRFDRSSGVVFTPNGDTRMSWYYYRAVKRTTSPTISMVQATNSALLGGPNGDATNSTITVKGYLYNELGISISNIAFTQIGGYTAAQSLLGTMAYVGFGSNGYNVFLVDARL